MLPAEIRCIYSLAAAFAVLSYRFARRARQMNRVRCVADDN
jgi:hypothetical protein